jgi:hypothetical protein
MTGLRQLGNAIGKRRSAEETRPRKFVIGRARQSVPAWAREQDAIATQRLPTFSHIHIS